MYKQKVRGSRGPLVPNLLLISNTLVFITLLDYFKRACSKSFVAVFLVYFFYVLGQYLIYRFSFVSFEYIWISEELIIKRKINKRITGLTVIPKIALLDGGGDIFEQKLNRFCFGAKNCCGTLKGLFFNRRLIVYVDENDEVKKIIFEPNDLLISEIQANI